MSQNNNNGVFSSPQVMASVIGGAVTIIVAIVGILPQIMNDDSPPAPVAIVQPSATPTPESVQVIESNPEPAQATSVPTEDLPAATEAPAPVQVATAAPSPNVRFLWDEVSFTVLNMSGGNLSLQGVAFGGGNRSWEARGWGDTLANNMPAANCLRMRDISTGQRQPPAVCSNMLGLQLVNAPALFWRDVESFDVYRNASLIGSCTTSAGSCELYIPQ